MWFFISIYQVIKIKFIKNWRTTSINIFIIIIYITKMDNRKASTTASWQIKKEVSQRTKSK